MITAGRQVLSRIALSGVPLLLFVLHALGAVPLEFVQRIENYLYDVRVEVMMPRVVDPRVVIVDIDEASLAAEGQWPWGRDKVARLMDSLFDDYGIRTLGFDVLFAEPERSTALELIEALGSGPGRDPGLVAELEALRPKYQHDRIFSESLIARDIVMGFVFKQRIGANEQAEVGLLPPPILAEDPRVAAHGWLRPAGYAANLPQLQQSAAAAGFFDTPLVDDDGVVRRIALLQMHGGVLYESLSLAVARRALGSPPITFAFGEQRQDRLAYMMLGESRIRLDTQGAVLIPFRGPLGSFRYISATDVLAGTAPAEALQDAIVLIGASAPGLLDVRATPVAKEYIGVEAHANLVSGMLDGTIPYQPQDSATIEVIALLFIALVTALLLPRLAPLPGFGLFILLIVAMIGLNLWFWSRAGIVLPLGGVLFYTTLAALLQLTWGYFTATLRRQHLSRIFGQYVPAEIVREIDSGGAEVSLEGESRDMSVLFSDVRGFTTISEGLNARELTRMMNDFLTPITAVIQRHRGTIDKYMGDAVMAFWGAPLPDQGHARHAVLASLEMIRTMRELGPQFAARGLPQLEIGVGISSGEMNVGNMGSQFRTAYTVLGDTVNLGSRLEGLTKQYGVPIIVSEATAAAVPDMLFMELDLVRVKGKQEPVAIFQPLVLQPEANAEQLQVVRAYAGALSLYRARRWHEAAAAFGSLSSGPAAGPSTLFLQRITHFTQQPPAPDWDGVFEFRSK